MAREKSKKLNYSYSVATQELMITTVDQKDLDKVENIMLDSDHYLQWDPKTKEMVGFFILFVDGDEKKEKFHSFPNVKELKSIGFNNFFKQLGKVCAG
ncbi:MAG: hypothetical protein ABIC82_05910 [bacterium]